MTFFLLIATAPFAKDVVTIMGSISGVRPTATEIANSSRLHPISFCKAVHKKYYRNHYKHKTNQNPRHGINSFFKSCLGRFCVQRFCHGAEHRIVSHRDNQSPRASAYDAARP